MATPRGAHLSRGRNDSLTRPVARARRGRMGRQCGLALLVEKRVPCGNDLQPGKLPQPRIVEADLAQRLQEPFLALGLELAPEVLPLRLIVGEQPRLLRLDRHSWSRLRSGSRSSRRRRRTPSGSRPGTRDRVDMDGLRHAPGSLSSQSELAIVWPCREVRSESSAAR